MKEIKMQNPLTQTYLHEILEYRDGILYWKVDRRKTKVGSKAGRTKSNGYGEVRIDGKLHGTHRLIFMMFHGFMPKIIDHIDCNPLNNKINNLREATQAQNMLNTFRPKNNTSGFKGVYLDKKSGNWIAQCVVNGRKSYLGAFADIHDAARSVISFREKTQGKFVNHG